jgi:hypothetical protein
MKKIALCFRGLTNYFLESYDNIQSLIIDDLKKEYDVDIFLNTYKNELEDSLKILNPVKILYNEMRTGNTMYYIVPIQIIECCELVKNYEIENNISYDYVIITRFDLTFNNTFSGYDVDLDKVNMECMFVPDYNSGDNFFLFKRSYLEQIITSVKDCLNERSHSHQLYKYFERNNLRNHYIGGETTKRNPEYDVMFRFTRYLLS